MPDTLNDESPEVVTAEIVFRDPRDLTPPERHRKSLGDMDALCESLERVGMLQPIGVTEDGKVILGERRRQAALRLGWTAVPTRVLDNLDTAVLQCQAERDENVCREPLSKEELGALAEQLLKLEKAAAEGRQKRSRSTTGSKVGKGAGTVPARSKVGKKGDSGRARTKVGKAVGTGAKTAERMAAITAAAKENPDRFGDLPGLMDRKSVSAAWKEYQKRLAPASAKSRAVAMVDAVGQPLPAHLRDVYGDPWVEAAIRQFEQIRSDIGVGRLTGLLKAKCERYPWVLFGTIIEAADRMKRDCDIIISQLKSNKPYAVCPNCQGGTYDLKSRCKECRHVGIVPKHAFEELAVRTAP